MTALSDIPPQCAAVNFVASSIAAPSICTNVTGLSAAYTTDPALSSLPATATAASTEVTSAASSVSTSSSTSTAKASDSTVIVSYSELSSLVWVAVIASATLIARIL